MINYKLTSKLWNEVLIIKRLIAGLFMIGIILFEITYPYGLAIENNQPSSNGGSNVTLYKFPAKVNTERIFGPFLTFSPLDSRKIWVAYRGLSYQFDTDTKQWSSLETILGSFATSLSNTTRIYREPHASNLIWIDDDNGMLVYNQELKKSTILNPNLTPVEKETRTGRFQAIGFSKDFVWLGAFNGLYCYNRYTNQLSQIPSFENMDVENIDIEDNGRIWVNQELGYFPQTQKVFQVYEVPGWPIKKVQQLLLVGGYKFFQSPIGVLDPNDRLVLTLPEPYKLAVKGDDVYLLNHNSVTARFDFQENKFKPVDAGSTMVQFGNIKRRHSFDTDEFTYCIGEYGLRRINKNTNETMVFKEWGVEGFVAGGNDLWGVTDQGIIHVNLLDDNDLFTPLAEIAAERDQISNMSDGIQDEPDVVIRIRKLAGFYDYLKQHSDWGVDSFEQLLQYQRANDHGAIKAVELFLTGAITPFQKELAYYTLAKIPIRLEQPELAFGYYNALKSEFPQSILLKDFNAEDVRKLNENRRLTQIQKMPKSREEEKLWLLGNFFHDNAPYSESLPDYRLSHQYLEDLLKRFPKSKWADNAAYTIIKDSELVHEDGDYSRPEVCIRKYQDFIKKYPDCEEVPRAEFDIADHYFLYAAQGGGFTDPQIFRYLGDAKKLCGEILQSKTDTENKENTNSLLKRINQLLGSHPWALEMKLASKHYKIGEPIVIAFKLKNMSHTVHKITIYKNIPNFGVRISRDIIGPETERDAVVMAIKVFPNQPRKTAINIPANGGEYNEQIVLQKIMIGSESGYVRYKITEPGTYKLTGFCNSSVDKFLETKEQRIVVTK